MGTIQTLLTWLAGMLLCFGLLLLVAGVYGALLLAAECEAVELRQVREAEETKTKSIGSPRGE
jgi:hypothetical protein